MNLTLSWQIDGADGEGKPPDERTNSQGDEKCDQEQRCIVDGGHASSEGDEIVFASKDETAGDRDTRWKTW